MEVFFIIFQSNMQFSIDCSICNLIMNFATDNSLCNSGLDYENTFHNLELNNDEIKINQQKYSLSRIQVFIL